MTGFLLDAGNCDKKDLTDCRCKMMWSAIWNTTAAARWRLPWWDGSGRTLGPKWLQTQLMSGCLQIVHCLLVLSDDVASEGGDDSERRCRLLDSVSDGSLASADSEEHWRFRKTETSDRKPVFWLIVR